MNRTFYRTFLAGLGLIGLGAWRLSEGHTDEGTKLLLEGLGLIGLGGKLDRLAR